jgi:hypothetical protein
MNFLQLLLNSLVVGAAAAQQANYGQCMYSYEFFIELSLTVQAEERTGLAQQLVSLAGFAPSRTSGIPNVFLELVSRPLELKATRRTYQPRIS